MQTPPNLNDQHRWGGERYRPPSLHSTAERTATGFMDQGRHHLRPPPESLFESQAGVIASSSDDLFHPATNTVPSSHPYTLPNLPPDPDPRANRAYISQPISSSRPLPHPSVFSSYNNPSFTVPPPHSFYTGPVGPPPLPYLPFAPPIPHQFIPQQPQSFPPAYAQPFQQSSSSHPLDGPVRPSSALRTSSRSSTRSSPSPTHSKTLPSVTHIPLLTSKHDAWDEAVTALIHANDLIGHILEPMSPIDPNCPDLAPTPLPVLPLSPSAYDIAALNRWWSKDKTVQHILVARLGSVPRGLLPSPNIATRTALSIYRLLMHYYGTYNFADCSELLSNLHNSTCTSGRVQEYVSRWQTGISRIQSAHFVFNIKLCIGYFVCGLPLVPAFNTIRADLPDHIAGIAFEQDYGAFITLTEHVLELDTIFRSVSSSHIPRPSRVSSAPALPPVVTPVSTPTSSTLDPPRVAKPIPSSLSCNNCKTRGLRSSGHTDMTCFQPGGGMEGRREEYMSNKGHVHAMIAACLENALLADQPLPPESPSSPTSPSISPVVDDDISLQPFVNLCVTSFAPNSDLCEDLYIRCEL